jgi:hypothetical protein
MIDLSDLLAMLTALTAVQSCARHHDRRHLTVCEHCHETVLCRVCTSEDCQCWNDE